MLRLSVPRSSLRNLSVTPARHTNSTVRCIHASPAPRSSWLSLLSAAVLSGGIGYALATFYPSKLSLILNYPDAPAAPPANSPEGQKLLQDLERQLQNLPLAKQLRAELETTQSAADATSLQPGQSPVTLQSRRKWVESRPYVNYPEEKLRHHLTANTLRGPGKLGVRPLVFSTRDNTESYIVIHLGRSLCGHDGIVHGGLLATLMDEALGRPALLSLPAKLGVTAFLHMNYKSPCFADQFVVIHTRLTKVEGRKAFSEADMSTLGGALLVNANALFVQPKLASLLKNSSVKEAFGSSSNLEQTQS